MLFRSVSAYVQAALDGQSAGTMLPFAVLGETTDSTGGLGGACAPAAA